MGHEEGDEEEGSSSSTKGHEGHEEGDEEEGSGTGTKGHESHEEGDEEEGSSSGTEGHEGHEEGDEGQGHEGQEGDEVKVSCAVRGPVVLEYSVVLAVASISRGLWAHAIRRGLCMVRGGYSRRSAVISASGLNL